MKRALLSFIQWYRRANTSLVALRFPLVSLSGCRSVPTCSEYALDVIRSRGAIVGALLAVRRIVLCNPFTAHVH